MPNLRNISAIPAAGFLEVEISPDDGYEWAHRLVQAYMGKPNSTLSATFKVPDALLILLDDSRSGEAKDNSVLIQISINSEQRSIDKQRVIRTDHAVHPVRVSKDV